MSERSSFGKREGGLHGFMRVYIVRTKPFFASHRIDFVTLVLAEPVDYSGRSWSSPLSTTCFTTQALLSRTPPHAPPRPPSPPNLTS